MPNAKSNKRVNNATAPKVVEVFKHRFIVRISIRLPHCSSVQQMALNIIWGVLKLIQSRYEVACIVKGESNILEKSLRELPKDWIDFYDNWSDWEDPPSMFKNTIILGKTRRVTGSVVFGCNWDPHKIIRKCDLSICKTGMH